MSLVSGIQQELITAAKLFRIKLRDARKGILVILCVMVALALMNAAAVLFGFAEGQSWLNSQYFLDFSVLLLILAPVAIAYIFWQEATGKNAIYPQTSISRFLSSQMLSLFLVLLALSSAVLLYLLILALFSLASVIWQPNLIMGYSFSPAFLATGFFAAFVFLLLLTSALSLITVLVRTFRLYAAIPLIGIALFYFLYPSGSDVYLPPVQNIFTELHVQLHSLVMLFLQPRTLTSFIVACLLASLVLLAASLGLRWLKPTDRSDQLSWMLALTYAPYLALVFFTGLSMYSVWGEHLAPGSAERVFPATAQTIVVDAGHLPADTTIKVLVRSFHESSSAWSDDLAGLEEANLEGEIGPRVDDLITVVSGGDYLVSGSTLTLSGRQITLEYTPAAFDKSSAKLRDLAQPELSMRLVGDRLYIDHSYTGDGNVLFMPIWSMMGLIQENSQASHPKAQLSSGE